MRCPAVRRALLAELSVAAILLATVAMLVAGHTSSAAQNAPHTGRSLGGGIGSSLPVLL